ncbi:MAG: hypothetical protein Q9216_003332 [Gyalolechia sp. 2 TL-2023]
MSNTLHSTPPTSDPRSTNHVNGFNEHSYYDPFFAAPTDSEQLVPISSHTSPDSQFYHSSSPSKTSRHTSLAPDVQSQSHLQQSEKTAIRPRQPSVGPLHSSANGQVTESALLSPNAAYTSDNAYDLSDHSGTPEFDNAFYLEDNLAFLADQADDVDLNDWPEPSTFPFPNATDSTYPSQGPIGPDPPSAGAVSLASHLMSPALTDNPSPGPQDERSNPTMDQRHLRGRLFDNIGTASAQTDERSQASSQGRGQMLRTPTLTGSSIDTSPERPTANATKCAPSPVFRIESYSRGDSPNRPAGQFIRSSSKRSRSSSHLAVEHDESSSDEEMAQEGRHNSGTTITPEGPRTGRPSTPGRAGIDPAARLQIGDTEVPNLKEQAESETMASKIADVEEWLAHSDTASGADDPLSRPPRPRFNGRRRAKSAGEKTLTHENLMHLRRAPPSAADMHIPGPGLVIDEESGEEDWDMDEGDEDEEEAEEDDGLPEIPLTVGADRVPGDASKAPADHQATSPPPLYRARAWQDPLYDSTNPGPGVQVQPPTANEAIMRFHQRSGDLETVSRAATWGTRRLSESDLEGLFHRLSFKTNDEGKEKRDRRGSFREAAATILRPKRSLSRRKDSDANKQQPHRPSITDQKKMDSASGLSVHSPQRRPSLGRRPKGPQIDTGSAMAAMAGQIAAVGAGKGGQTTATTTSPPGSWKNVMTRDRSSGNLTGLLAKHGGPPMPTLAAPPGTPPKEENQQVVSNDVADLEDDEEDEAAEEKGITIDLSIREDPIIPTMEGFRSNVRQLNPRLPHFLAERVAQEQLRRYKKLIEFKVKHAQALATRKCPSAKHCFELGGEPTYLPSKVSGKETGELSHPGFTVAGLGQSDDDANALADGAITPAQFPPGVPMPPVKRLPAEFECSLCFKVKKFQKPSDWSKHVHEDVQPFTCTFPSCAEPKSFKRKADWVRHENERHRQLEWWMCNMNDCTHTCYRKDNFVQHLVREHKLPEPKVKTTKAGKPAVRGPSSQKARAIKGDLDDSADELDLVWRLVDECRQETKKNPRDEPCKFCGNVCNSWKKLTVHLAKHMEQISMPVLAIAKAKEVTPETLISPIEQRISQSTNSSVVQSPFSQKPLGPSPPYSSMPPYGNMSHHMVPPMGDLSASYTPAQNGFYDNGSMSQFQRNQASTYPQPQQQAHSNYTTSRGTPYKMPSYAYDYNNASSNQFVPINQGSNPGFQYPPQSSSPENLYGGLRPPPPSSQPRTASFVPQPQVTYPPSTAYAPTTGHFPSSMDNSNYGYHGSRPNPSTSAFSQGLVTPSTGARAQAPVAYGAVEGMSFPRAPAGGYGQQRQGGGQGYEY